MPPMAAPYTCPDSGLCVLDWGNTRVKALLQHPQTEAQLVSGTAEQVLDQVTTWELQHPGLVVVGAEVGMSPFWIQNVAERFPHWHWLRPQTPTPFDNLYRTPQQLGMDRRVLAAGAVIEFPNQAVLVVDAGSCVTFDEINAHGQYLGGAISPGLRMRYQAMHAYTARLPLLEPEWVPFFPAGDTADNMHRGSAAGLVYEIDAVMADFAARHTNFIIILTGGDASFLATHLKSPIFVRPNFLLESIGAWYQFLRT